MELGDKVKDIVSGFSGIMTARYEYLNGCIRIEVSPDKLKDGTLIDARVFDIGQMVVVKKNAVKRPVTTVEAGTGGPQTNRAVAR